MAFGLLLVAMNAIVAGHWANVKAALVSAPGTGTPTVSGNPIGSAVKGAVNSAGSAILNAGKPSTKTGNSVLTWGNPLDPAGRKQIKDALGRVASPPEVRLRDNVGKPWWMGMVP